MTKKHMALTDNYGDRIRFAAEELEEAVAKHKRQKHNINQQCICGIPSTKRVEIYQASSIYFIQMRLKIHLIKNASQCLSHITL